MAKTLKLSDLKAQAQKGAPDLNIELEDGTEALFLNVVRLPEETRKQVEDLNTAIRLQFMAGMALEGMTENDVSPDVIEALIEKVDDLDESQADLHKNIQRVLELSATVKASFTKLKKEIGDDVAVWFAVYGDYMSATELPEASGSQNS